MAGWHPEQADGGLLPSAIDPNNPAQAFNPAWPPIGTAARFFGNGCDVRLRPAVLNSLISENLSTVDLVGLNYNPSSLINLRTAIQYLGQKRIASFTVLTAQGTPTNYYRGSLTPPLLHGYNNGQVLCVVPNESNQGFVRIDLGGGWWVPVLRNDYAELEAEDWPAWVPQLLAYFNGAFFQLGLSKSQVPIVLKGTIWFWVRPDGNDITGDGTENSPAKAFRTLQGAWNAVGSRFSASPNSNIAFMLGVPGDYEGAWLGPYGSTVSVYGDRNNRSAYRIHSTPWTPTAAATACLHAGAINRFYVEGVTCWMDQNGITPYGNRGLNGSRSGVHACDVDIVLAVDQPNASYMLLMEHNTRWDDYYGWLGTQSSMMRFIGNGHQVANVLMFVEGANFTDAHSDFFTPVTWYFENIRARDQFLHASTMVWGWTGGCRRWVSSNVTGKRYSLGDHTMWSMSGNQMPGTLPGTIGQFSLYNP